MTDLDKLADECRELLEWYKTGHLCDGLIRQRAAALIDVPERMRIRVAEDDVKTAALRLAAHRPGRDEIVFEYTNYRGEDSTRPSGVQPMTSLIDRLEKATEPSRELDALIEQAINPKVWMVNPPHMNGSIALEGNPHWQESPHYTSSLDTALTLVPEGLGWNIQGNTDVFYAMVAGHNGNATTPSLALLLAIFRARAALAKETE